jgi:hypothetical protein
MLLTIFPGPQSVTGPVTAPYVGTGSASTASSAQSTGTAQPLNAVNNNAAGEVLLNKVFAIGIGALAARSMCNTVFVLRRLCSSVLPLWYLSLKYMRIFIVYRIRRHWQNPISHIRRIQTQCSGAV